MISQVGPMWIKLQGSLWNSGLIILASLFSDAHGEFTGLSHTFTSLCRSAYCRSLPALPPARPLPFDIRHIEAHWRERLCPVAMKGRDQNHVTSHSSCATHHPRNTAACHCMHAHPEPLTVIADLIVVVIIVIVVAVTQDHPSIVNIYAGSHASSTSRSLIVFWESGTLLIKWLLAGCRLWYVKPGSS